MTEPTSDHTAQTPPRSIRRRLLAAGLALAAGVSAIVIAILLLRTALS